MGGRTGSVLIYESSTRSFRMTRVSHRRATRARNGLLSVLSAQREIVDGVFIKYWCQRGCRRSWHLTLRLEPLPTFGHGVHQCHGRISAAYNNTLGDSLWREALAMVDDLLVASSSLTEHRVHMDSVLHKLARRHHSLKPSKARNRGERNILFCSF